MDIETLLGKAEKDGCMVVLNDIAPNRERSELVFRVPESVYDTPAGSSTACASSVRMIWLSPTTPPE